MKRSEITGWSRAAVRRHTRWLYSVDPDELAQLGSGFALTLTLKENPADAAAWQALRRAWQRRMERRGMVAHHWVVEWQRRKVAHLHVAAYFAPDSEVARTGGGLAAGEWVRLARPYGATIAAQHWDAIDGPLGWLQYLSKHAARGVAHYQRQGKPPGWEKTGRLWGHTGEWPTVEPADTVVSTETFLRFRRACRSWRLADARSALRRARTPKDAAAARRRIVAARRMLRSSDRRAGAVRGVSEWLPLDVVTRLLAFYADQAPAEAVRAAVAIADADTRLRGPRAAA